MYLYDVQVHVRTEYLSGRLPLSGLVHRGEDSNFFAIHARASVKMRLRLRSLSRCSEN